MIHLHVWHADPDLAGAPAARNACLDLLDSGELERLRRYRFDADSTAYLAAHALLRSALSQIAPIAPQAWRFRTGELGKPFVDQPTSHQHLSFSLSHTAGRVAVAISARVEVGIDVEHPGRASSRLEYLDRFLSPSEASTLRALPAEARSARFLAYWTLKEAYLKARGLGLSVPLQDLSFHLDDGPRIRMSLEPSLRDDSASWQFFRLSTTSDHPVAVAIRCRAGSEVLPRVQEARELPLRPPENGVLPAI
jgi:4'-phosphopantetheinyl transferase